MQWSLGRLVITGLDLGTRIPLGIVIDESAASVDIDRSV